MILHYGIRKLFVTTYPLISFQAILEMHYRESNLRKLQF